MQALLTGPLDSLGWIKALALVARWGHHAQAVQQSPLLLQHTCSQYHSASHIASYVTVPTGDLQAVLISHPACAGAPWARIHPSGPSRLVFNKAVGPPWPPAGFACFAYSGSYGMIKMYYRLTNADVKQKRLDRRGLASPYSPMGRFSIDTTERPTKFWLR
jgi:hypothetical protein